MKGERGPLKKTRLNSGASLLAAGMLMGAWPTSAGRRWVCRQDVPVKPRVGGFTWCGVRRNQSHGGSTSPVSLPPREYLHRAQVSPRPAALRERVGIAAPRLTNAHDFL